MTTTQVKTILVPLVGLVAVLATGFGGQALFGAEVRYNALYFDLRISLVAGPLTMVLTTLLSLGALLWLFWWVMAQTPRSRLVAAIYLVVGLFCVSYFFLCSGLAYLRWLFLPMPFWLSPIVVYDSMFTHVAGGAAVAGLLMLVLPRQALTPAPPPKGEFLPSPTGVLREGRR